MSERRHTFLRLPRGVLAAVLACHDVIVAVIALQLAFWLRAQFPGGDTQDFDVLSATLVFGLVSAGVFYGAGLHRGVWRFTAFTNLVAIARAAAIAVLIFVPALFLATRLEHFPRSTPLFLWPILVFMLAAPRFLYRAWRSGTFSGLFRRDDPDRIPVLVLGLNQEADRFVRETQIDRHAHYSVIGLLDQDPGNIGRQLRGVPILGTVETLSAIVADLERRLRRPQKLILAPGVLDGPAVRGLLDEADRLGLSLARIPRPTSLSHSAHTAVELQPVDVGDLLGRPQRRLDRAAMERLIAGRRVLVTGAGGTIGGELCRQIAALKPAWLTLLDNGEFALYAIDLELGESDEPVPRQAILGDVREARSVERIFAAAKPDIVFHAAALKHVPLVEANPAEGVRTNVAGTRIVADACRAHGVQAMVLISTDKAVHPSSVMGATKRIAELYCQALERESGPTRYVTVRFGNVLGSTGSVVPLFQRQLARGGPLTVTHPEVSRYFMTVREAVELVLQAAALPRRAEGGHIFVLDMGEPVLIADLARQIIRLAGLRPEIDIEIAYTGLRPGEKMHERLFHEAEPPVPTDADGILLARPRVMALGTLAPLLERLFGAAQEGVETEILTAICTIVPEFGPGAERQALHLAEST